MEVDPCPGRVSPSASHTEESAVSLDRNRTAAALPDSDFSQVPLQPPSPYHPQVHKRGPSVTARYVHNKLSSQRSSERGSAKAVREDSANRWAASAGTRAGGSDADRTASASQTSDALTTGLSASRSSRVGARDVSAEELRLLQDDEEHNRIALRGDEDLSFTHLLLEHLSGLARAVATSNAADEGSFEAAEQEEAEWNEERQRRARERQALLETIAARTAARLSEERLAAKLQQQFTLLLPEHQLGRDKVMCDEEDDLQRLFAWERNSRPLGAGCFIAAPVVDPRLRYCRRLTGGETQKPTTSTRMIEQLRVKRSGAPVTVTATTAPGDGVDIDGARTGGELIPYSSDVNGAVVLCTSEETFVDPPNTTPEEHFVADGQVLYSEEKRARHAALQRARATLDLCEGETAARADIQLSESEAFMPLLLQGVDGVVTARRLARQREINETDAERQALEDYFALAEAKARVLAEDFEANGKADAEKMLWKNSIDDDTQLHATPADRRPSASESDVLDAPADHPNEADGEHSGSELSSDRFGFGSAGEAASSSSPLSLILHAGAMHAMENEGAAPGEAEPSSSSSDWAAAVCAASAYLMRDLWARDLLMPTAAAVLLSASAGDTTLASAPFDSQNALLLQEMAVARAAIVREQIECVLQLFGH